MARALSFSANSPAALGEDGSAAYAREVRERMLAIAPDGKFPEIDKDSEAWSKAVAVARIARENLDQKLSKDVLWYHADYVAPVWRKALDKEAKIGLHIFYS